MKIVICDDDKTYVNEIENCIKNLLQDKRIPADFDLYSDSGKIYNSNSYYDIAFLDVEMKPYSGIEIAERLKRINPYVVIFIITSHEKYLDDAMDLNVFRYIKKPLDVYRLKSGLEKAIESIDNTVYKFFLKQDRTVKSVNSNDIVYVETVGRATKVVTTKGEYLSDHKIDFWKSRLVASFFYQVHKSFIINLKHMTDYQRDTVTLLNKYKIPISYRNQSVFRSYFLHYLGGTLN